MVGQEKTKLGGAPGEQRTEHLPGLPPKFSKEGPLGKVTRSAFLEDSRICSGDLGGEALQQSVHLVALCKKITGSQEEEKGKKGKAEAEYCQRPNKRRVRGDTVDGNDQKLRWQRYTDSLLTKGISKMEAEGTGKAGGRSSTHSNQKDGYECLSELLWVKKGGGVEIESGFNTSKTKKGK